MKHNMEINYEGGLEKLANDIGDLRYDSLQVFLDKLSDKLYTDSLADYARGRPQLAANLSSAHYFIGFAREQIKDAWKISEPFMRDK